MEQRSEEKEKIINKKYKKISLIVLIVGLILGGSLIAIGVIKANSTPRDGFLGIFGKVMDVVSNEMNDSKNPQKNTEDKNSNQEKIKEKEAEKTEKEIELKKETEELEVKRSELLAKDPKTASGFSYNFAISPDDGDAYTLKIITNALENPSMYCWLEEYTESEIVEEYCSTYNEIEDLEDEIDYDKRKNSAQSLLKDYPNVDEYAQDISDAGQKIAGVYDEVTHGVKKIANHIQSRFFIYPGIFIVTVSIAISACLWFGVRKKALGKENHVQGPTPKVQEVTEKDKDKK